MGSSPHLSKPLNTVKTMTDYPLKMIAEGDGDFVVRCGMRPDSAVDPVDPLSTGFDDDAFPVVNVDSIRVIGGSALHGFAAVVAPSGSTPFPGYSTYGYLLASGDYYYIGGGQLFGYDYNLLTDCITDFPPYPTYPSIPFSILPRIFDCWDNRNFPMTVWIDSDHPYPGQEIYGEIDCRLIWVAFGVKEPAMTFPGIFITVTSVYILKLGAWINVSGASNWVGGLSFAAETVNIDTDGYSVIGKFLVPNFSMKDVTKLQIGAVFSTL